MRAALLVCVFGAFAGAAPEPAPAPRPVVGREREDPPPEVAALLKRVRAGDPAAATALGRLPEAEPYLRFAELLAPDKRFTAALAELHAGNDARNVERAKKWAADGRIDLLVEAVCLARSDAAADALTEHLYDFAKQTSERASELLTGKKQKGARLGPMPPFAEFAKDKTVHRHAGEKVDLDNGRQAQQYLIRAGQLSFERALWNSVAVVRDKAIRRGDFTKFWEVLLFVNGDVALGDLSNCLVVTDGDLTRWEMSTDVGAEVSNSVVIARGSIRDPARISPGIKSCVWAGGNITLRKTDSIAGWALLAGGDIRAETPKGKEPALVKGKTTDNPFGVRFFETKEVGVEVEDHADGVRIASLAPDSPLAMQGLRVGDVVFRVNDTATDSAKEFRRELRRAVVWEVGVFWLAGDGKRLTRVVRFPDAIK